MKALQTHANLARLRVLTEPGLTEEYLRLCWQYAFPYDSAFDLDEALQILQERRRDPRKTDFRHRFYYLLWRSGMSLNSVGALLGRDRTTVMAAVHKIEGYAEVGIANYTAFSKAVGQLLRKCGRDTERDANKIGLLTDRNQTERTLQRLVLASINHTEAEMRDVFAAIHEKLDSLETATR